jgi:hypothetical protein
MGGGWRPFARRCPKNSDSDSDHKSSFMMAMITNDSCDPSPLSSV